MLIPTGRRGSEGLGRLPASFGRALPHGLSRGLPSKVKSKIEVKVKSKVKSEGLVCRPSWENALTRHCGICGLGVLRLRNPFAKRSGCCAQDDKEGRRSTRVFAVVYQSGWTRLDSKTILISFQGTSCEIQG